MNKVLFSLFFSLLMAFNASATKLVITEGTLSAIKTDGPVSISINFNDATVDGITLDAYLVDMNQQDEFAAEINNYYADFIKRFNRDCKLFMLTRSGNRDVELTVNVKTINSKGNEATIDYVFTDMSTGQRLAVLTGTTKEGRFGSFSNLVGDVIREAGGDLGSFVSQNFKSRSKAAPDPIYN